MSNNFSAFQAVLFDMDGVLFYSTDCHERAYREVLRSIGIDQFTYPAIAGMRTDEAFKRILSENNQPVSADLVQNLTQEKRRKALALLDREGIVADGSGELLLALQKRYRLVLASSASPQTVELFLKKSGYAEVFEHIIDGSMVERAKPAPDIYILAAERLGVATEHCVVIEDSVSGIRAAQSAGSAVIAIVPQIRQEEFVYLKPDMIVSNITELTVLLR